MHGEFGNYTLLHRLHAEPVGQVHLGRHRTLERDVHVLLVEPELASKDSFQRRFFREMRRAGALVHPQIQRVVDLGRLDGRLYAVLEFEDGCSTSRLLAEQGSLAPSRTLLLGGQLAGALIHAHLKGMLHRHIHPSNVWIRPDGSPVLKGFGLAPPELPWSGPDGWDPVLFEQYLAPEVLDGASAEVASDIWSLGALLLCLFSGTCPFPGTGSARIEQVRSGRPDLPLAALERIPAKALDLLRRMVAFDPAQRPDSLYVIKATLEELEVGSLDTVLIETPPGLEVGVRFEPQGEIGGYEVLEQCGEGAFGAIYKVREVGSGRVLALKVLKTAHRDVPSARERFQREWQALSTIDHPHIVKVVDAGCRSGVYWFVMEFVNGPTLHEVILERGRLELRDALRVAREVAGGLQAAHEAGVMHRDLSASNILLDTSGKAIVSDFGLALLADRSRLTQSGDLLGTPRYMAPEVAQGVRTDPRSDLYSLGVVLYEALAGYPPFDDQSLYRLMHKVLSQEPPIQQDMPEGVPASLKALLLRLLEKAPENRPPSAAEVIAEIGRLELDLDRASTN